MVAFAHFVLICIHLPPFGCICSYHCHRNCALSGVLTYYCSWVALRCCHASHNRFCISPYNPACLIAHVFQLTVHCSWITAQSHFTWSHGRTLQNLQQFCHGSVCRLLVCSGMRMLPRVAVIAGLSLQLSVLADCLMCCCVIVFAVSCSWCKC